MKRIILISMCAIAMAATCNSCLLMDDMNRRTPPPPRHGAPPPPPPGRHEAAPSPRDNRPAPGRHDNGRPDDNRRLPQSPPHR